MVIMFTFYDQRPMSSINCNLLTFHILLILFQGHLQFMMTFWQQRSSSILRIEKDKVIYIFLLVKFLFAGNSVWPRQKWWRDLSVQATMWQVIFKIFVKILSQYFKISLTTKFFCFPGNQYLAGAFMWTHSSIHYLGWDNLWYTNKNNFSRI